LRYAKILKGPGLSAGHGRVRVIVRMDLNANYFALPKVHAVELLAG